MQKKILISLFLALVVIFSFEFSQRDINMVDENLPAKSSNTFYKVVRVIDGDTFVINIDGEEDTIRLIGIDSPEVETPYTKYECFGREASEFAKTLLKGKLVRIETDSTQSTRDSYNRILAYVYFEDGTLVNKYLIEEGYAHEYTFRAPYEKQVEFNQAESDAKTNKRGLWADNVCAPLENNL